MRFEKVILAPPPYSLWLRSSMATNMALVFTQKTVLVWIRAELTQIR